VGSNVATGVLTPVPVPDPDATSFLPPRENAQATGPSKKTPDDDSMTRLGDVGTAPPQQPRTGTGTPLPYDDATRFGDLDSPTMPPGMPGTAPGEEPVATGGSDSGPLAIGQAFGSRYHIIRMLGIGGMGAVYQAWDAELGVAVAIKVIRPDVMADPTAAAEIERRFKRELLLARQVTHKNVVRIHDIGDINGIKYITMPYVEGADLASVVKKTGRLPTPKVLRIARAVASGLVAAHTAGVVHRDLKPANIMVDADDEAMIMDFGIARSTGGASREATLWRGMPSEVKRSLPAFAEATTFGAVVGTVEYMAPEQARGQAADQRADIYAFGLIVYDLLLGRRRAEHAVSAIAELQGRMEKAPPPLHSIEPDIPEAVERIVARCIEPDPEKRYQTSVELEADLNRLDAEGKPLPIARRVTKPMVAAIAALLLTVGGTTYWLARGRVPVEHEPMPVLIADFVNRTGDTAFEGALERMFSIGVEGASFITSYDRNAARKALGQMGRDAKLDETAARLIATREGIKVILAGAIEPRGGGYSISVNGIDPADGKTLWTKAESARSKNEVLGAIGSLTADVRKVLGDTTSKAALMAPTETFTSSSLEAVQNFSRGQDLLYAGKYEEAIKEYQSAIGHDASIGRAYAGLATALYSTGQRDEAERQWKKALALTDRMTEREKYRTLAIYYARISGNYEKAIEIYSTLVEKYPSDWAAHGNLGGVYFLVLDFPKALEETRKAVKLAPRNILYRNNSILMAMYAGDFATAVKEAEAYIKEEPGFFKNYLPLAVAAIDEGRFDAAVDAYNRMAKTGSSGASLAVMGLADLAMYRGRYTEAEAILKRGIEEDQNAKNTAGLAAKQIALAETYAATGRMPLALHSVQEALKLGRQEIAVLVPAARLYVQAGKVSDAEDLAAELDNKLQTQPRAYAKTIDGNIALLNRRRASALDAYRAGIKLADFWMERFDLGVTYVQSDHYAEALAELELCQKRRGEATAIFLDETPSFRYLAPLPYWLARAQEGLGQQAAAVTNYKAFLSLRPESPTDRLVVDARKRAGS